MTDEKRVLLIPKIEEGIVIDHIPSGHGVDILDIIRSDPDMKDVVITLGLNYKSTKFGKKDLIKLRVDDLTPEIVQDISLICPGVTIKKISGYAVERKVTVRSPQMVTNRLECRNPNCITNHELHLESCFKLMNEDKQTFKCVYCERVFHLTELRWVSA